MWAAYRSWGKPKETGTSFLEPQELNSPDKNKLESGIFPQSLQKNTQLGQHLDFGLMILPAEDPAMPYSESQTDELINEYFNGI